jgi:hypothetical protein
MRRAIPRQATDVLAVVAPIAALASLAVRAEMAAPVLLASLVCMVTAVSRLRGRYVGLWSAVISTATFDAVRSSRLPHGARPSGPVEVLAMLVLLSGALAGTWRRTERSSVAVDAAPHVPQSPTPVVAAHATVADAAPADRVLVGATTGG